MTNARREWLRTFADPALLADLFKAARSCMTTVDGCDPDLCSHPVNQMTPVEFAQWVEDEINAARRSPIRLDHHENRKAGQEQRWRAEMIATG